MCVGSGRAVGHLITDFTQSKLHRMGSGHRCSIKHFFSSIGKLGFAKTKAFVESACFDFILVWKATNQNYLPQSLVPSIQKVTFPLDISMETFCFCYVFVFFHEGKRPFSNQIFCRHI